MAFEGFDDMDSAIRGSKTIGIVVPMQSGTFRVNRFELNGAARALDSMRESTLKRAKKTTKDITL